MLLPEIEIIILHMQRKSAQKCMKKFFFQKGSAICKSDDIFINLTSSGCILEKKLTKR